MAIEISYGLLTPNFILRRPPLHPLCSGAIWYQKSSSEGWDSGLVDPAVFTIVV